jgi:hypothetical protein
MAAGDVLLSNHANECVLAARERGVYVALFTTPYINNRGTPAGKVVPMTGPYEPGGLHARTHGETSGDKYCPNSSYLRNSASANMQFGRQFRVRADAGGHRRDR